MSAGGWPAAHESDLASVGRLCSCRRCRLSMPRGGARGDELMGPSIPHTSERCSCARASVRAVRLSRVHNAIFALPRASPTLDSSRGLRRGTWRAPSATDRRCGYRGALGRSASARTRSLNVRSPKLSGEGATCADPVIPQLANNYHETRTSCRCSHPTPAPDPCNRPRGEGPGVKVPG